MCDILTFLDVNLRNVEKNELFLKSLTKCPKRGGGAIVAPPPLYAYVQEDEERKCASKMCIENTGSLVFTFYLSLILMLKQTCTHMRLIF